MRQPRWEGTPDSWSIANLSDVAEIIMGQSPPSSSYNEKENGLPFFQGKAEFGDKYPIARKWCTKPTKRAKKSDILMSVRAPVGAVNLADMDCCIGRGLAAIRVDKNFLTVDYLYSFLQFAEAYISLSGQGSTFSAISGKDLTRVLIPVPPLQEQQEIVNILQQAEDLRRLRQDSLEKAEKLASALFLEMFGDPDPQRNQRWDSVPITKYFDIGTGGTPKRVDLENYNGSIGWAKSTDLKHQIIYETEETISEQGVRSSNAKVYPKSTILLAMYGQGKTRGHTAKLGISAACNQACAALVPKNESEMTADYLWHWMQCSYDRIRALGRGGQQENLNLKIVKSLQVTKPPLSDQTKFGQRIEEIYGLYKIFSENIFQLEVLNKIASYHAFSGKLTENWRQNNPTTQAPITITRHIDDSAGMEIHYHRKSLYPIQEKRESIYDQLSNFQKSVWDYIIQTDTEADSPEEVYLPADLTRLIADLPEEITENDQTRLKIILETFTKLGLITKVSLPGENDNYITTYRALRETDELDKLQRQV